MSSDAILSTKRAILSSGGTVYNDLYYNTISASASLLECTFQYNQIISLPSMQFGSQSAINVPNDQFIDVVILNLRLPQIQANETICRGWGYRMIQSIAWTLGSSNSTQIMLQGDSILQTVMGQIPEPSKRLEVLRLAGEEILAVQSAPTGQDLPYVEAYVVLPLPFSTLCDKLPFDTTMLQNNINLQIQFVNNTNAIYGGTATHPTAFTRAELIFRMGKLSDQSKSVRAAMIRSPDLKYAYPFIHSQHFMSSTFAGVRESDGSACNIDLNTFLNADLVAISFWVIADSDKSPSGNNSPNPWKADNISNVVLSFAGQTLFNFPGRLYKLTNMLTGGDQGASYIPTSTIAAGTVNPFTSAPYDSYMCFFDFSRLRSTCIHSHFFNTWRLTNQTLNLQFNTTTTSTLFKAHCTFYYNAVAEIQNGTSAIYID